MRWVIGDIHGMLTPLKALVGAVADFDPAARFVFTGDYVDRGPDSRGVVDFLLSLRDRGGARFVRGNHDDLFDLLVNGHSLSDPSTVADPARYLAVFVGRVMAETLTSYGLNPAEVVRLLAEGEESARLAELIAGAVPAAHREFFRDLPLVDESADVFVAHARWDPDEPDRSAGSLRLDNKLAASAALRHDLLWGRFGEREIRKPKRWRRAGYFGHTPVEAMRGGRGVGNVPVRGPNIVLLDTGVALGPGGRLTGVCVETGNFIQVDPAGRVLGAD